MGRLRMGLGVLGSRGELQHGLPAPLSASLPTRKEARAPQGQMKALL